MNGIPDGITLDAPTPDGITLDAAPAQPSNVPFGRWGRAPVAQDQPALAPGGQLSPYAPPSGSPDTPTYAAQPGATPTEVAIDNSRVGRILDGFGQGAKSQWGDQPLGISQDSEKWLREHGLWNDYEKGQASPFKSFNEMLMRPVAAALDATLRALSAIPGAAAGGGGQALMETGLPQALEKAGHIAPEDATKDVAGTAAGAAEQFNTLLALSGAAPEALLWQPKALGVTQGEAEYAGTAAVRPGPTVERAAVMPPPAPPVTIAQAALKIGDQVFTGTDHGAAYETALKAGIPEVQAGAGVNGFTTSAGDFVDRPTAAQIAAQSGQPARTVEGALTSQGTTGPTAEELAAATTPEARTAAFAKYGLDAEGKPVSKPISTPDAPILPPEPSKVAVPISPAQRFDDMPPSEGGTKLNLNYDAPQDIRDFIRQQAIAAGDYTVERRTGTSWAESERLGQAMGLKTQDIIDRKVGEINGASWMDAATNELIDSTRKVREIWQKAATGSDADKLAALEAEAQHAMLMASVVGNEAEIGRALNILKKFKQTTREARDVDQLIKDNGGIENLRDRAEKGALLDTPGQISGFIRDAQKPRLMQMVQEVGMNWLLSGPITQTKNIVGNMTTALWRTTESSVAAGIGVLRGMPEDRVMLGEPVQRVYSMLSAGPEMLKAGWKAWKEDDAAGSKLEAPAYQAIPSLKVTVGGHEFLIGGKQIRIPGRALAGVDAAFKALAYRQSIAAQAWRRAAKAGTKDFTGTLAALKNNPTAGMIERAAKEAELQTLSQGLGKTGKAIQTVANHNLLTKIVAPFVKFGINSAKFAGERSVLSVLHPEIRKILAGDMGAAARDEQLAKIAVGSAVSATAVYLAAKGHVTGEGPKDPAQRALLRATGWQPYSIKIGDVYYAGNWNDPASTVFFTAADMYEIGAHLSETDTKTLAELVMGSVINNIASKTYFQGASDALDAIQDPVRYGPQYINKLAGTAVPTGVAQWARVQDPYLRDARTIMDTIKSRLPKTALNPEFNSESVFPSRDVWGNAIKREGAAGPDIISPVYTSTAKHDPVTDELLSLGVFPAKLDRQIRGVDLDAKEYDDYQRVAGKLLRYQLEQVIGRTQNWGQIQPGVRQEILTKVVSQSRELARKYVMLAHPDIMQKATQSKIDLLTGQ